MRIKIKIYVKISINEDVESIVLVKTAIKILSIATRKIAKKMLIKCFEI